MKKVRKDKEITTIKKVLPKQTDVSTTKIDKNAFPIVGIGASAGGLEALEQFFSKIPANPQMAFVIIQHLDPHYVGIMPELLQRLSSMKVIQASDRVKIKPNCVYIIPPNKSMSILNRALHLFDIVDEGLRLPINFFFRSLANDLHEKSIGIILSGMGSDGSEGVKAIKEKHGMVLVQEPSDAKFDSMPKNAIASVVVDKVANAEQLPEILMNLANKDFKLTEDIELDDQHKSNIDKIIILLREHIGHDFSSYKKKTLFRRIERRKSVRHCQ
ncbi:MAG: hypothetical protein JEZ09_20280 [Salinivirgaceae bacterium]|nr:hypothetical protein [Salinivirgaceae bacterium]